MGRRLALWRLETSKLSRPELQIWLCLWWILSSIVGFANTSFWEQNRAELNIFFQGLPWIGCVLIPYLTMKYWARDRELGIFVWFFSLPQSLASALLSRYFAAWLMLVLALLGTWPIVVVLIFMGRPDFGIVASGYVGCLGILSVQLALCMVASCLCDRRLSAYLLGLLLCICIHLPGIDSLVEPISQLAWLGDLRKLQSLGTARHLSAALRGVIDSRDLTYVLGLIFICLCTSGLLLQWHRRFLSLSWKAFDPSVLWGGGLLFIAALTLVPLSRAFYWRWDWTEERLYTLSEGTRAIVAKLPEPVVVSFYFSRSHPEFPPLWKAYGQHIAELLRAYARMAPGLLKIRIIDPAVASPEELEARMLGLISQSSSEGDPLFLGAKFEMGSRSFLIPFFDPDKEDQLEYELSEALIKIAQSRKPLLGVLSSLPMVGDQTQGSLQLRQDWAIIASLRKLYEVVELSSNAELIPDSMSTVLVIHPKGLTERTEYALDQYLLHGGNLLIAVDPLCRSEMLFQAGRNPNSELSSHLPRLFSAWGLSYDPHRMVGDPARAGSVQSPIMKLTDPFQLNLQLDDFNLENPISQRLEQIRLIESGWFDGRTVKNLSWQAILQSTSQGGIVSSRQSQILSAQQLSKNLVRDHQRRDLVGILSGNFRSAFTAPPRGSPITYHKSQADESSAIVLFADVDFMTDLQAVEKLSSQTQQAFRPLNDNLSLVQKSVEYVGGNKDLIHIRSSSRRPRPLLRFQQFQEQSQLRYQAQVDRINAQLASLQDRLNMILSNSAMTEDRLPSVQRDDLRNMRTEEAQLRNERRQLQRDMLSELFWFKTYAATLGALGSPIFLGMLHLVVRQRRRRTQLNLGNSVPSERSPTD